VYVVYGNSDIVVGEAGQGMSARSDRMDPGGSSTKLEMVELGGGGLAGGQSGKVLESAAVVLVVTLVGVGEVGPVQGWSRLLCWDVRRMVGVSGA
jgi:hypothetical protein